MKRNSQSEFYIKESTFNRNKIEKHFELNNLTNKNTNSKEKTKSKNFINKKNEGREEKKESQKIFSNRECANKKQSEEILYIHNEQRKIINYPKNIYIIRIIFISLYFIFISIFPIKSQTKEIYPKRKLNSNYSEITIKIKGTGIQTLISQNYTYINCPNEAYINETKVAENNCPIILTNPETEIRMVWFEKLTTCEGMFYGLSNITEIDLSKFDSSSVRNTQYMFYDCLSLESLNLANFDTSKVNNMLGMFQNCRKLKSLDISNFNTSLVTNMQHIFENCNLITSLDLSHFNTTLVQDLGNLFYNCWSLRSINLSNFNTISNYYTDFMFYNCTLESIDLSSFNTSIVSTMNYMFYNCTFLKSLNLSNFDIYSVKNMDYSEN